MLHRVLEFSVDPPSAGDHDHSTRLPTLLRTCPNHVPSRRPPVQLAPPGASPLPRQQRLQHRPHAAVEVLVNNAGHGGGPVEEVPLGMVRETFEINVFAVIRRCQLVLPGSAPCSRPWRDPDSTRTAIPKSRVPHSPSVRHSGPPAGTRTPASPPASSGTNANTRTPSRTQKSWRGTPLTTGPSTISSTGSGWMSRPGSDRQARNVLAPAPGRAPCQPPVCAGQKWALSSSSSRARSLSLA